MADIRVPTLGESVTEASIGRWFKKPGDAVAVDEPLVEIETDKVNSEIESPYDGVLAEVLVEEGATVPVGEVIARIERS
jgi:2-oxoglutarate dehydrogenase E2 component (dihydrolipoamide succinyltransferase)